MYLRESDGLYPLSDYDIRAAHPRSAFPAQMPDIVEITAEPDIVGENDGDVIIADAPLVVIDRYINVAAERPPAALPWHRVEEGGPAKVDGEWLQQWRQVPLTESEILAFVRADIQSRLDALAAQRGYGDSGMSPTLSILSYIDDANPIFAAEAAHFKKLRSAIQARIKSGEPMPDSYEAFLAQLPAIEWSN